MTLAAAVLRLSGSLSSSASSPSTSAAGASPGRSLSTSCIARSAPCPHELPASISGPGLDGDRSPARSARAQPRMRHLSTATFDPCTSQAALNSRSIIVLTSAWAVMPHARSTEPRRSAYVPGRLISGKFCIGGNWSTARSRSIGVPPEGRGSAGLDARWRRLVYRPLSSRAQRGSARGEASAALGMGGFRRAFTRQHHIDPVQHLFDLFRRQPPDLVRENRPIERSDE